jgi:hypothetical protein
LLKEVDPFRPARVLRQSRHDPLIPPPANNDNDKPVRIVAVMGEKDGETYYQSEDGTGIPASQLQFSDQK